MNTSNRPSRRVPQRKRPSNLAVVVPVLGSSLLTLTTCVGDVEGPQQTLWLAALEGHAPHHEASGSVAAITTGGVTEVSIAVEGLLEGTYAWRIHEGECTDPGALLGVDAQYPDMVVAGDGQDDSVETQIGATMAAGGHYYAEIRRAAELMACGEFEEQ